MTNPAAGGRALRQEPDLDRPGQAELSLPFEQGPLHLLPLHELVDLPADVAHDGRQVPVRPPDLAADELDDAPHLGTVPDREPAGPVKAIVQGRGRPGE